LRFLKSYFFDIPKQEYSKSVYQARSLWSQRLVRLDFEGLWKAGDEEEEFEWDILVKKEVSKHEKEF